MAPQGFGPALIHILTYRTYPVLVHGVPTTFDMLCNGWDIPHLINTNTNIITHPLSVQHTEFLAGTCEQLPQKTQPLIIYFMDPIVVNSCIAHQISFYRQLHPVTRIMYHPPQLLPHMSFHTLMQVKMIAVSSVQESTAHVNAITHAMMDPLTSSLC